MMHAEKVIFETNKQGANYKFAPIAS